MAKRIATGTVEVRDSTLSMLMLYAVRYAMGRRTYVVEEVVRAVMSNRGALTDADRNVIIRDITEAAFRNELGDPCDSDNWRRLVAQLRPEESARLDRVSSKGDDK